MELGDNLFSSVMGTLNSGVGVLTSTLGGIAFFGTTIHSETYDHTKLDEKHYFLIPHAASDKGFALYIVRCLPDGVPPINDLPKRRLLHLPNQHALPMLEEVLMAEIRQDIKDTPREPGQLENNIVALIDEIDELDSKVFKGVLLMGGLVAMVNPLAGAAVAMKAMVPAVGMIASKHGLKFATDKMTNLELSRKINKAEKDLKRQFQNANTLKLINPVLSHMEKPASLETWMMEPHLFRFECEDVEFSQADLVRLMELSEQAISDVTKNGVPKSYFKKMKELILWGNPISAKDLT